ncbi:hypothetical protein Plhal703r1_c19g0085651 [Plasmopara halstedii]
MDVEYIDTHESEPIRIDEYYYSLPTPKPKADVKAMSQLTLDGYNRITTNNSPAKVYLVEIPSLAQLRAKYQ